MAERSGAKRSSSGGSSGSGRGSSGSGRASSGSGRASSGSGRASSGSGRASSGSGSSSASGSSNASSRRKKSRMSGREAIERARADAAEMLGRPIESVLGLETDDNNGWRVTVEIVELERIPRSTDVLGVYVITLDESGEMTGARRERRYYRNQADEGQA